MELSPAPTFLNVKRALEHRLIGTNLITLEEIDVLLHEAFSQELLSLENRKLITTLAATVIGDMIRNGTLEFLGLKPKNRHLSLEALYRFKRPITRI